MQLGIIALALASAPPVSCTRCTGTPGGDRDPALEAPIASAGAWPTEAAAGGSSVSEVSLLLTWRSFDSSDWSPVDEQVGFGIEFDSTWPGLPLGWEVGFL